MTNEEFTRWCERNSIASKLTAALEMISVGRDWGPFKGLENGEITVKIVHDGVNIHFTKDYKGAPGFEIDVIPKEDAEPKPDPADPEKEEARNLTDEEKAELKERFALAKRLHDDEITQEQYEELLAKLNDQDPEQTDNRKVPEDDEDKKIIEDKKADKKEEKTPKRKGSTKTYSRKK